MRDFALEAERVRRRGDARTAIEIAETALASAPGNDRVRMALVRALLDQGDVDRARRTLDAAFPAVPPPVPPAAPPKAFDADLGDDELDVAFAEAETNPEEMLSANRVVERTLENEHVEAPEAGFDVVGSATYATETMAALLEEQGRRGDADALRESFPRFGEPESSLDESMRSRAAGLGPDHVERLRVVATLESWLHNLRQNAERDARERSRAAGGPSSS